MQRRPGWPPAILHDAPGQMGVGAKGTAKIIIGGSVMPRQQLRGLHFAICALAALAAAPRETQAQGA